MDTFVWDIFDIGPNIMAENK
uniref:Uncharacterized protein n=1 Tax=Rhizophora mucronata TaxID=61149 RepID=A0A2P2MZ72_RHIMU